MPKRWTGVGRTLRIFAAAMLAGCAHMEQLPPANTLPRYSDPDPAKDTAIISGSSTTFLFQTDRTRIQSVDGHLVALKGSQDTPTVLVAAGEHVLVAIRVAGFGMGNTRVSLHFNAVAGHEYVVRSEEKTHLLNVGTKFWIEDRSLGNARVSEGEGWAPTHGSN